MATVDRIIDDAEPRHLQRRSALTSLTAAAAATLLLPRTAFGAKSALGYDITPMEKSAVKAKASKLTELERAVALKADTEMSFTGKTTNGYAHDNKTPGYYVGSISGLPLFSSKDKYDSGTGWPSFKAPVDSQHVILRPDPEDAKDPLAVATDAVRTEVLDAVSGAHLGHVFPDGPRPTFKRFCMNAAALTFVPSEDGAVPKM